MIAVHLFYGLAFFTLGLAALLESRRDSVLLLGRQLSWLAAFGLTHSLVEWSELVALSMPGTFTARLMTTAYIVLLPLSALFLIRFGVGLISESGPLPQWLLLSPLVLIIPIGLVTTYAIVVALTEPDVITASDIWSRYLLYIPGSLLAAAGFFRQAGEMPVIQSAKGRNALGNLMRGAALAFVSYAFFAGLIVPPARFGLAPWLNYEFILETTSLPVQVWRTFSAFGVTLFVVRALNIFEYERKVEMEALSAHRHQAEEELRRERERAQKASLRVQTDARLAAETWVNTLVDISRRIAHMEDADTVLTQIVHQGQHLLQTDTVSLGLFDESGEKLELKYHATAGGPAGRASAFNDRFFTMENEELLCMLRSSRSYCFPEDRDVSDVTWYCPTVTREIKAAAVVPLQFDGQVVGGIWAARFTPEFYTPAQLFGLENLADQAVIVLQHASMASQLQSVATLEERSRIAREMHDGLAQILGYLGLQMQTIEAYFQSGRQTELLAEIHKTRENIKLAQADVRENILSLRTTLAGEAGLIPALQEYVAEFGIQTATSASFTSELKSAPNLSPLAEVQLVRIVQEALTNVRKHAGASHVDVTLSLQKNGLSIVVVDDGVGFRRNGSERHFGLQTMTERASSIGGKVTVNSVLQHGTEVQLWLPLLRD